MGAGAGARLSRWRVYLTLGRVSNLPTVWTNALAGAVLGGQAPGLGRLALLGWAFSLFYAGGMYLNDAFDRELDARERPERPIPSGLIRVGEVFAIGFGLLAAALGVLAVASLTASHGAGWRALGSGILLAGAITAYDAWHQGNPLAPVVMGLCRALVYLTAALAVAGRVGADAAGGAAVLLCYLVGLTCIARQETLRRLRNGWPLLLLAAPFVYARPADLPTAAVYAAFLGWVGYMLWLLARPAGPAIREAVAGLIAGVSLLDALLIAGVGDLARAAGAFGGFLLTLALQRWVPAT